MFTTEDLYDVVATYADFGHHHTGTDVDVRTATWLCELLKGRSATVWQEPYTFDRFTCTVALEANRTPVPVLPLFYSAVGDFETGRIDVVSIDTGAVGNAQELQRRLPTARPDRALAVAIAGPDDLPVQCNRVPTSLYGQPAVVIPANWAERVETGAQLWFAASLEPGTSANVLAELGDPEAPAINITTPLTGWTPAAGERGTGLAVAVALAVELSDEYRVNFSACSGHELDHIGLRHHLANRDVADQPTIHLGASIAATEVDSDGPAQLGARRFALTTASGEQRSMLGERALDANWTLVDADPWPGEGGTWRQAGASVLSFLGGSSRFHTTADTVSATSPEAIALAAEVAIDCTRVFLSSESPASTGE